METDEMVWLSAMAALGDHAPPDALLDELLTDVARSHVNSSPPRGREIVLKDTDTSGSSASVGGETDDAKKPLRKRKRIRNYNPKKELDALRRSKADLENLLTLARQRRRTGRVTPMLLADAMDTTDCTPKEAMWMGVATRQYKLLRESQIHNEHLRAQVLNQMHIVRGFLRLVQRAEAGLPSERVPRALPDAAAAAFSAKRRELLALAAQLHDSIDEVCGGEKFESSQRELNEIATTRFHEQLIPPGVLLTSGLGRRYVPLPVAEVNELLWALDLPKTRPIGSFNVDDAERAEEYQSYHGTVRFSATAEAAFVLVRHARILGPSRRSIVSVSSLSPNPGSESPWNVVGVTSKHWIDIRESNDKDRLVEVRSRTDLSRMQEISGVVSPMEARVLQEYARKAVTFSINRIQSRLDSTLLGAKIEVVLAL